MAEEEKNEKMTVEDNTLSIHFTSRGVQREEEVVGGIVTEPLHTFSHTFNFDTSTISQWGVPKLNKIVEDHEKITLLALLRHRLLKTQSETVAFLRKMRCLGADIPLLATLAKWLR